MRAAVTSEPLARALLISRWWIEVFATLNAGVARL